MQRVDPLTRALHIQREEFLMTHALDGLGYRGKTTVVTGGSSGMGEATARLLGELGASVHIVDIQQPKVSHESFHRCDLSKWVQYAAVKLGNERRIRFNAIGPCPTKTAFMDQSVKVLGQEFLDKFPYPALGRMATPEEQAWPLILLNSSLNAAVTGSFLYTDQGFASGVFTGAIDPSFMSSARK